MAGISYEELLKQGATPHQQGGMSFDELQNQGATPISQSPQPQEPGLWEKLKERGRGIVSAVISNDKDPSTYERIARAPMAPVRIAGNVAGAIGDVVGAAITSEPAKKLAKLSYDSSGIGMVLNKADIHPVDALKNPLVQSGLTALKTGIDKYDEFAKANPNAAKDIAALANVLSSIPFGGGAKAVGTEAKLLAGDAATAIVKARGSDVIERGLNRAIDAGIEKGIRPTVVGKATPVLLEQSKEKAREAVKTIVRFKDRIKLTDDFGEATGKIPQNLNQFSQAIGQTKEAIFNKYNTLAKQAGTSGADVDLAPIATELGSLVDSPVLQDIAPEVVNYAKKRGAALINRGRYTTEQAQEAIKQLNSSLDSFYRNPSPSEFSKLQVDALIVNNMRQSLDNVIENTTGAGYQKLKNLYGALKSIEKDVAKRSVVDARKNAKGLIDFTDIFSAGDIISGVATMNPAQISKGVFQKMVATAYKRMNDPNRIIKKMFEGAEKSLQKIETAKKPFNPKSRMLNVTKTK